jgi:hypothetical protein
MSEATINDFAVQLEFTVGELNGLVSLLNRPQMATVSDCMYFISAFQKQAQPQIVKAQAGLDAVKKTKEKKGEE